MKTSGFRVQTISVSLTHGHFIYFSQVKMGQLMDKEMCGGISGDRDLFSLPDQTLLNL